MAKRTVAANASAVDAFSEALGAVRPYVLPVLGLTFGLLVLILTAQSIERFLYEDPRFKLRKPEYGSRLSPDIRLAGLMCG